MATIKEVVIDGLASRWTTAGESAAEFQDWDHSQLDPGVAGRVVRCRVVTVEDEAFTKRHVQIDAAMHCIESAIVSSENLEDLADEVMGAFHDQTITGTGWTFTPMTHIADAPGLNTSRVRERILTFRFYGGKD